MLLGIAQCQTSRYVLSCIPQQKRLCAIIFLNTLGLYLERSVYSEWRILVKLEFNKNMLEVVFFLVSEMHDIMFMYIHVA